MSFLSNIYALASAALYIRSEKVSPLDTEALLEKLSFVFSEDPKNTAGYLYYLYKSKINLSTVRGFDSDGEWGNLENLINGNYKTKIGLASLLYSFSVYSNLDPFYQEYFINKFNSLINKGYYPPYIPYSEIQKIYNNFSLEALNLEIAKTPKDYESRMVNYNWYDSEVLFSNPGLNQSFSQKIKDSENQYYYISGEMIYDININFPECIKENVVIKTSTGDINTTIYSQLPCFDKETYIGPVSGIKFYRMFNDGPPSSGYFDKDTLNAYVEYDEKVLNNYDYLSNKENLYSFQKDSSGNYIYLCKNVQLDSPGVVSLEAEYGIGHTNIVTDVDGCRWEKKDLEKLPFMRMHQGDNLPKYWYFKEKQNQECVTGIRGPYNWTGWKFAGFELKDSWIKYFNLINTNPRSDKKDFLKRALNIENYLEIINGQKVIHSPYLSVSDNGVNLQSGYLTSEAYIGPPQLNYSSSSFNLPGFAFYQTFDNINFGSGNNGEFIALNIHPAISNSNFSQTGAKSSREIKVSNYSLFTGKNIVHNSISNNFKVEIKKIINASEITGFDEVFSKCISIGDNFGNEIYTISSFQSNAGYEYTGYTFYRDGAQINGDQLFDSQNTKKVAADFSKIRYITGYLDSQTNNVYSILALSSHFLTGKDLANSKTPGEYLVYYYFNTLNGAGEINSVNTGWSSFAPIPEGIQADISNRYQPLYGYQKIENHFPRYSKGPFATYENKILYPNANQAYIKYNSKIKGFPNKISYILKIKEESVREFLGTSGIKDGSSIKYEEIVRAGEGNIETGLNTLMIVPFSGNEDFYLNTYDFNLNKSLYSDSGSFSYQANLSENYVNCFFVPSTDFCKQKELNSVVYRSENNNFINGVSITGDFEDRPIYIENNLTDYISVPKPKGRGYFWGYNGKILSGDMLYTAPIFNLSSFTKEVNSNMLSRFGSSEKIHSVSKTNGTLSNNGLINNGTLYDNNYNGRDPIFYEYIGGRIGLGSELEGGNHSKGIVGDAWYDFNAEEFGYINCGQDNPDYRYPSQDKYFILLSLNSGSLDIFTRALNYYPYYLNLPYKPFLFSSLYEIGIDTNSLLVENEFYYTFNLKDKFPLISVDSDQLYYESGLEIGPFDRDVEFCLINGNSIKPSGNFLIDNRFLTTIDFTPTNQMVYCNGYYYLDIINKFSIDKTISPGINGRNQYITTFKLIPSGKKVNINISGGNQIGFDENAIVTIRPRTTFNGIQIDGAYLSGDVGTLNPFNYINNGSESKFSLFYKDSLNELIDKKFEYVSESKYEILLPEPGPDFDQVLLNNSLLSYDSFGNKFYYTTYGPTFDYWKIVNPDLEAVILRDVSRVSFEITSLNIEYGDIPFQTHKIIIPSGKCFLSGEFSYTGQAESALISQGFFLSGSSGAKALTGIIDPYYVSDILKRIPSGIQKLPSGSGIHPILEAPSYVKERENYFYITGGDKYIKVFSSGLLNYNKFIWPALSDLALLNPDLVYEQLPPDDGTIFPNNFIHFSASQGQLLSSGISGLRNPNENVTYKVNYLYGFIDSVSTNSLYNTGKCILKLVGDKDFLDSGSLTGILIADGVPLSMRPLI